MWYWRNNRFVDTKCGIVEIRFCRLLLKKFNNYKTERKNWKKELQQLKEKSAVQAVSDLAQKAQTINGVKVVIESVSGVEPKSLRIHGR